MRMLRPRPGTPRPYRPGGPLFCAQAPPEPGAGASRLLRGGLGLLLALAPACRPETALAVGHAPVLRRELDQALEELRTAYASFGEDTLRWHLLQYGMGPAAVLHHRWRAESDRARAEARRWAARLRAGEPFDQVYAAWEALQEEDPLALPVPAETVSLVRAPSPAHLGGRVAAAVAALEDGEWAGPLRTRRGWEIVYLERRADPVRSRASVRIRNLVFRVGPPGAEAVAEQEWNHAWLSGDPDLLAALPRQWTRGRLLRELARPSSPE